MKPITKSESFRVKNLKALFDDNQCNLDDEFLSEGEKIQIALCTKEVSGSNDSSPLSSKYSHRKLDGGFSSVRNQSENIEWGQPDKRKFKKSQFNKIHNDKLKQRGNREDQNAGVLPKNSTAFAKSYTLKDEIKVLLKMLSEKNKRLSEQNICSNIQLNQPNNDVERSDVDVKVPGFEFLSAKNIAFKKQLNERNMRQANYKDITMSNVLPCGDIDSLFD